MKKPQTLSVSFNAVTTMTVRQVQQFVVDACEEAGMAVEGRPAVNVTDATKPAAKPKRRSKPRD